MNGNGRRNNRGNTWNGIPNGRLSDTDLNRVCKDLVSRDGGQVAIRHAYIILHVGEVVWHTSGRSARRQYLGLHDETELQPGEIVTIITDECIRLPPFVIGAIFAKGLLPSIGLLALNTTIDPGFEGYLRVTVFNVGAARVRLPRGLPIAKVDLTRLSSAVARPYGPREDPKVRLPRDDYLFAGEPLVMDAFRSESSLQRADQLEERVVSLERAALRLKRTLAGVAFSTLFVLAALLLPPVLRWIKSVPDVESRSLFLNLAGGILLAVVLALGAGAYRRRRDVGEMLSGLVVEASTTSDTRSRKGEGDGGGREGGDRRGTDAPS